MNKLLLMITSFLLCHPLMAQEPETASDTLRKDALNVFMEASDHIRREIPFINYVRDIKDADVYIISTSQQTGSGGREFTYFLVGQRDYAGMKDTLTFATAPDETEENRREKQVSTLKMGLMRYVAKTPLAEYIDIRFTQPMSESVSIDKWNSWVFEPSIRGALLGEKSYAYKFINAGFSADRITEEWKIRTRLSYYYNVEEYDIGDEIITSNSNSKYSHVHVVKSINDHWSYGGSVSVHASTYNNLDFKLEMFPGIEYNLFPYSESTRRQLRILYAVGYSYADYIDSTIYDKTWEHLWLHGLDIAYQVIQKWGSINLNVDYRSYLHDWSKNNFDFGVDINLRIAKGLSLNVHGNYSIIHDQLSLVKGGASPEEILLHLKQLETQYSYYVSCGFSFTFGSIYNNVVNPRFGNYF